MEILTLEKFHIEGAFKIRGLLNAGELELNLHGPSEYPRNRRRKDYS